MNVRVMLAAGFLMLAPAMALPARAQDTIAPKGVSQATDPAKTYPVDQVVTASVHDAWLLSGKSEDAFFDIVQQLATISADKRGVKLPDDAAAGRRMGNYIKAQAKLDHDQLLYVIVDKAVRMVAKPAPTVAAK